jgi:DNA-binding response OmpR family regulator
MPGIDGIELARRIRAESAIEETRLVLYSSIDDRSGRQELRALGFAGHLSKPMRRAELLATMERVLSHAALEFTQRLRAIVTRDVIVEDHQRRGRTVLLVEDNATNRAWRSYSWNAPVARSYSRSMAPRRSPSSRNAASTSCSWTCRCP